MVNSSWLIASCCCCGTAAEKMNVENQQHIGIYCRVYDLGWKPECERESGRGGGGAEWWRQWERMAAPCSPIKLTNGQCTSLAHTRYTPTGMHGCNDGCRFLLNWRRYTNDLNLFIANLKSSLTFKWVLTSATLQEWWKEYSNPNSNIQINMLIPHWKRAHYK